MELRASEEEETPAGSARAGMHIACHSTLAEFYRGLDSGDIEAAVSAFAADGVWHRQGTALNGEKAIRAALLARDPARRTCHAISNFALSNWGPRPEARYYLHTYLNEPGSDARLAAVFDCHDRFFVTEAGPRLVAKTSSILLKFEPAH